MSETSVLDSHRGERPLGRSAARGPAGTARRVGDLSRILRLVGGFFLLVGASVFLLQRWEAGGDLGRYATLFGLTVVVFAAGLFCAQAIGESKAARTFLALSLGLVPVHVAVLGGFVYSRFSLDRLSGDIPRFGVWVAPSDLVALALPAIALALLVPIVLLAARALAPGEAGRVTALVFATHLTLLLPLRGPGATAGLLAALWVPLLAHELLSVPGLPVLRTPEGLMLRSLLAVPAAILLGRSTLYSSGGLYPVDGVLLGTICLLAGVTIFSLARRWRIPHAVVAVCQGASVLPAAFGWMLIADHFALPGVSLVLQIALPIALFLMLGSIWALRGAGVYRRLSASLAVFAVVASLVEAPGVGAALLTIVVGLLVLAYGFFFEQKLLLLLGLVAGLTGVAFQVHFAVEAYSWSRWGGLAVLGLLTVLAAAVLEKHRAVVHPWTLRLADRVRGWGY